MNKMAHEEAIGVEGADGQSIHYWKQYYSCVSCNFFDGHKSTHRKIRLNLWVPLAHRKIRFNLSVFMEHTEKFGSQVN
jgi:hypothetical protein